MNSTIASSKSFNYATIPLGFYDAVYREGSPIRRCWHIEKFERVVDCLPAGEDLSILDVGCFAGTFLSLLDPVKFSKQVGFDVIKEQVEFAHQRFGAAMRRFTFARTLAELPVVVNERGFDCVTMIEVIEHLKPEEIQTAFAAAARLLRPGGKLVISTPNYLSTWPLLELILNQVSHFSYEDQHITKFFFPTLERKLNAIVPDLSRYFSLDFKTTTHFISPFLAVFGVEFARKLSRLVPHNRWKFPFGNLTMAVLTRNESEVQEKP